MTKTVRAHTNIALIKYWGKKDSDLKIPHNSSLSLTLDRFYTDTSVRYDASLTHDVFILDGNRLDGKSAQRVFWFMDQVRKRYNIKEYAYIESKNHVPEAAGLASSASAFAALAKAATLGLNLPIEELSALARLGSGSASRSLFPGFAIWEKGVSDETSFAHPLGFEPWDDFRMVVALVNDKEKPFSSSTAMDLTAQNSVYFPAWVEQSQKDLQAMTQAIKEQSIEKVGLIAQENALRMHASLLGVNMWYFEPKTIEIMNIVRNLQKEIPVYFTMDAGPNVKIITLDKYVDRLIGALNGTETIVCSSGPGAYVL